MMHTFSILDYPSKGKLYGKYKGNYPSDAAPKAFSKLSSKFNMLNTYDNKKFLKFTIVNTKTNKKKTFIGTRIKLHTPVIIRGHKYYYKNLITPYPKNLEIKVL
tara:strand:- start:309 stop:620 length:312 start_codon:yes stop_codon:yes gene_type:complete